MSANMNILIVASEVSPFAKTGGLADVTSALGIQLKKRGHDVRVIMPFHQCVRDMHLPLQTELPSMCVRMGMGEEWCSLLRHTTAEDVPIIFVEHHHYFDRTGLYHDEAMHDYHDNPRRYGFLCRAALQYCMDADFAPDIVHVHDWHTSLIPAYLKIWFWNHQALGRAASVLTVHNAAHQGVYPFGHYGYLGLGDQAFTPERFESWGQINILKGGIHYADMVNTVSPSYAREITTPHGGFGLAPYFEAKGDAFRGVLNGVDYSRWCPEKDTLIPKRFSPDNKSGKAECRRALQKAFKLQDRPDVPIIGAIGRFVSQKGYHLVRGCIEDLLWDIPMQFVILGSGDWENSSFFGTLPSRCPGRAGSFIGYSEELAHLIEAGSDFFLMPSIFEPCGLNQLYSLRYGTLPIVHATGGLDDTVQQYNEQTGEGTGFKFYAATAHALYNTVRWAVSTWHDRKQHMEVLIDRAMRQDFSWEHAVLDYEKLYDDAIAQKCEYDRWHS